MGLVTHTPITFYFVTISLFLLACLAVAKRLLKYYRLVKSMNKFPSLHSYPLLGSIKHIKKPSPEFIREHGERVLSFPFCYVVWIGPIPQLNVVHPETIKPILKMSDPKHHVYNSSLKPWLGDGLLISSGRRWFRSRRMLTPAFHFDVLKPYMAIYNDASDILISKIDACNDRRQTFPVFENISLCTLDIIMRCAFSNESGCQEMGKRHPYIQAVYELGKIWQNIDMFYRFFPRLYRLTADGRKFARLCDLVHMEAESIIEKRRTELRGAKGKEISGRRYLDFLDILLTSQDTEGKGLEKEDIRAEVDTFLFEGHDTTASGISWVLYALATHPEYQERVHEEVDEIFQGRSDEVQWEDLNKLKYTSLCLKESLRLYCPVPIIARELTSDVEIHGHTLPAGSDVGIPIWSLHHNPLVWGEDHMDFRPDRFLPENSKDRDPYAYIPFSAGPRNCIGQNFALNEEKTVLTRLMRRFRFEIGEDSPDAEPTMMLVLRFEKDIRLHAIPRNI